MKKIGIIQGSLRKGSFNKSIARYLASQFGGEYEAFLLDISQLPLYNQDLDENDVPHAWTEFRKQVKSMDAFIFVTPEYNRSLPPAIKNALDVASRPYGENAWSKKPAATASASVGKIGGFGANNQLRQSILFLDMLVMAQPEVYISDAGTVINGKGEITDETVKTFLNKFVKSFIEWIERF